MPAAKTATPALALAIRLKTGSRLPGKRNPVKTMRTASIGDQQTGSFNALKRAFDGLTGGLPAAAADCLPGLSRQRASGMVTALTTMATTATTRPTVALVP